MIVLSIHTTPVFIVKIRERIDHFLSNEGELEVAVYKVLLVFGTSVILYDASVVAESPCSVMLWLNLIKLYSLDANGRL